MWGALSKSKFNKNHISHICSRLLELGGEIRDKVIVRKMNKTNQMINYLQCH